MQEELYPRKPTFFARVKDQFLGFGLLRAYDNSLVIKNNGFISKLLNTGRSRSSL